MKQGNYKECLWQGLHACIKELFEPNINFSADSHIKPLNRL